ncbi:MAG: NAD(P)H-dependent oxidoreductase, partial [Patescibacteria group bacterium]
WLAKDAFRNKPVGLVGNCGSRSPVALEALRPVIRTLYGYALQTQIATEKSDFLMAGDTLVLSDIAMKQRCQRFVEELLQLTVLLKGIHHETSI